MGPEWVIFLGESEGELVVHARRHAGSLRDVWPDRRQACWWCYLTELRIADAAYYLPSPCGPGYGAATCTFATMEDWLARCFASRFPSYNRMTRHFRLSDAEDILFRLMW